MSEYDPLLTMSALNMAVVSLHRITSSGDRLILDREYDTIINNLRMGEINPDLELTSLYQEIVRVIHKGRLRDDIRATINTAGSERKHKSIKEIITGNVLKSFSTNPLKWLGKLAMSSAAEYFTQQKELQELTQNNNDTQIMLKHDELDEYDDLQRRLLGSSWTLLRQYHLPDSYRLTQNALAKFSEAMNEEYPSKRQRMLKYLESDFAMYAPYWFYRAKAADEAGDSDETGKCFAKFAEVWRPVLRKDPYRVEEMKYRIKGLIVTREETGEILKCLEEMRAHTELEDWANNIFAGMVYFSLGYKEKAEECVMCNIDFGYEREMSSRLLEDMKTTELPLKDDEFLELCESGDARRVEEAIMNGANVNAKNKYGKTALMEAARNKHADVAELLLKHGADVNAKDNNGSTALMWAADSGTTYVAELLLKHGADVNAKDNNGSTALMWAADSGTTYVAELLLKYGADVNAKDNDGKTVLMWAMWTGLNVRAYGVDIVLKTCMLLPTIFSPIELVELLLKHGADVNAQDKDGDTALMDAALIGRTNFAELLLKHGADVNAKNYRGLTALDHAERVKMENVAEILRKYGAKEKGFFSSLFSMFD